MVPGVSPYLIPARVPLRQMPVVVNLPAIPNTETPAPGQAMEEILIIKAENMIDTKMDIMKEAIEAWMFQLSKANGPRYRGYQTARAYAIQVNHPPPYTLQNCLPRNATPGPAYYRREPNYQRYSQQGLGPCKFCDELGHIRMLCPDLRIDKEKGIFHLNDRGRLTLGPRGGNGVGISRYQPERRVLSKRE